MNLNIAHPARLARRVRVIVLHSAEAGTSFRLARCFIQATCMIAMGGVNIGTRVP